MSSSRDDSLETDAQQDNFADHRIATPADNATVRRAPDDIDAMLEGHFSPIKASLTEAPPLVAMSATPRPAADTTAMKKQPLLRKQTTSISPSPKPATSKGHAVAAVQQRHVPMETIARKPAIPKMKVKRASPPWQAPGEKIAQDPASVASRMALMSAKERVELGLRQLRSMQHNRPSSAFATATPRTSFGLTLDQPDPTPQQVKKEQLFAAKLRAAAERSPSASAEPTRSLSSHQRYERQSSWARDTVERGLYLTSWSALPQTVPRKHVDPSPGPGAYTPPLHFLGAR